MVCFVQIWGNNDYDLNSVKMVNVHTLPIKVFTLHYKRGEEFDCCYRMQGNKWKHSNISEMRQCIRG